MKAKVIIENGRTEIVLSPENDFDKDVLEKVLNKTEKFSLTTKVESQYSYSEHKNHKLIVEIIEIKS